MPIASTKDTIIWRVHLRSSPQQVYEFLASDAGRAKFWAESAVEHDGVIDFRFVNGVQTKSRILESQPPNRIVMIYFDTRVAFDLVSDGAAGTDLTMSQTEFDSADREDWLPGWCNVLFPLKAAADFGVDLRNHDPQRTWERGYIDQ